eukprot:scaffold600_cov68-Cylindrotheca_fusiformis.AAC.4
MNGWDAHPLNQSLFRFFPLTDTLLGRERERDPRREEGRRGGGVEHFSFLVLSSRKFNSRQF